MLDSGSHCVSQDDMPHYYVLVFSVKAELYCIICQDIEFLSDFFDKRFPTLVFKLF